METQKKTAAWKVAELLEEIAKKAEPYVVLKNFIDRTRSDTSQVSIGWRLNPEVPEFVVSYFIPFKSDEVDGTIEEVVAYIETGLGTNQSVGIVDFGTRKQIAISQIHREKWIVDEMKNIVVDLNEKLGFPLK